MARFKLGDKIGYGQFCVVHEARTLDDDGEEVGPVLAMKRMQKDAAVDEELRARFQREGRLMGDVLNHPNIVSVVSRNMTAERPFVVMPKAETNLSDQIKAGRCKDSDWVITVFRQVLEAIAYAHDKGVIHRDLKPRNLLLDGDVVKVTDFGIGKELDAGTAGLTKTNAWFGTEPYMAPEQFKDMKETTYTADVFSLGKLLMHMLTGETPDVGAPDVSEVPERFRYFVQRCCAKKPENRFKTARQALEAFDRVVFEPIMAELPSEALQRLVEDWWNTGESTDEELQVGRWIDEHVRTNPEDEAMFVRAVPRLPEDLLDRYMDQLPEEFKAMIAIYDGHVSGALPFDYCDIVTDFYERIFRRTADLSLRETILRRLFRLGKSHNRWYVRIRTLTMLSEVIDPSTVATAADVIRAENKHSDWFAEKAPEYGLPKSVRKAFQAVA